MKITYVETGIPITFIDKKFFTQKFENKYKRKYNIFKNNFNSNNTNYDDDKKKEILNLCKQLYKFKEIKWLSKHYFMNFSPFIVHGIKSEDRNHVIYLPSIILRKIFVYLYGHGP
tara:strand:+ start:1425 stop:1769 length:345 start_codon:yes stop_codon:yes gene_type:complete